MTIVPAPIEKYTKLMPRNIALVQGIAGIGIAIWALFALGVVIYAASPFSIVHVSTVAVVAAFVKWSAVGAFGVFLAVIFLDRYNKHP